MNKGRWQHLDLRKRGEPASPAAPAAPADPPPAAPVPAGAAPDAATDPTFRRAAWLYSVRQFELAADLLLPLLEARPDVPGVERLLGLALARQGDLTGARQHLGAALAQAPGEASLTASLLSVELRGGRVPDLAPSPGVTGPAAELFGAAAWRRGQQLVETARAREAARAFREAGELLKRSSPPEALPERLSAAYLGETISYLVAGELDAAQQGYARTADRDRLPEAAARFARGLYELAETLRQVPRDEWGPATAPLAELLLGARLRVALYDGEHPVEMFWDHLL